MDIYQTKKGSQDSKFRRFVQNGQSGNRRVTKDEFGHEARRQMAFLVLTFIGRS